jgi:hypothetical protein
MRFPLQSRAVDSAAVAARWLGRFEPGRASRASRLARRALWSGSRRFRASQRWTVDANSDAMMLQAVEQCIDQRFIVEQFIPTIEVEIRGDDGRDSAVAFIHETEEDVDLFRLKGNVAQFVNEQRLHAAQICEQSRRGPIGKRRIKFIE